MNARYTGRRVSGTECSAWPENRDNNNKQCVLHKESKCETSLSDSWKMRRRMMKVCLKVNSE